MKFLNNRGFSLMELVVAMMVSAIVALIGMQFLSENLKFMKIGEKKSEFISDMSQGRNLLYKDFRNSGPSFLFFDYPAIVYDLPEEKKPKNCVDLDNEIAYNFWGVLDKETCQGFELRLADLESDVSFIRSTPAAKVDSAILSPEDAYSFQGSKATYKKDKFHQALKDIGFEDNKLFKLQAINNVEDTDENLMNFAVIYSVDAESLINSGSLYTPVTAHCMLNEITSIDQFFRCLPALGLKKVKVTPINLITYKLTQIKQKDSFIRVLQRMTTKDGSNFIKVNMFFNLTSVRIYRENPTNGVISFDIDIPKVQNNL